MNPLRVLASLLARHECAFGCGFKTHDLSALAGHYHLNHAGDRL